MRIVKQCEDSRSPAEVLALSPETQPTPEMPEHGGAGGLTSRSFLGLLVAQFFGAVNDNMFRWLVVPIGKQMIPEEHASLALSVVVICLELPFLLLAAVAGYLADRFSKRTVIVGCKVAELVILILGVATILSGNLWLMFGVVFLLGSQSALFGPSKFGSIPEIVRPDRISAANGLIGMTTVVAIVIGSIGGACLYELTAPLGRHMWWVSAVALLGVGLTGLIAAVQIAPLGIANPARRFPYNFPRQTVRDLAMLASDRPLLRAALGAMVFWSLGALAQVNVDQFVDYRLGLGQMHVGILLGILATGVGVGSVLAGIWSAGRVELGIVSLGAAGIAASAIVLSLVPPARGAVLSAAYFGSCLSLFFLGASAGLYQIPIQAFLQYRSSRESRGSILAASGFLAFSGMLASAVLFWLCSGPFGLRPEQIFLMLGIATVPVFVYVVLLLPGATARFLVWLLSHTIYRVRVEGRQNVPKRGGALLVANHVSFIDGVLLILYFPRPVRMVARADPVHKWGFRRLAEDLGTIFIEPGKRALVGSIRTAREAIRQGDLVCIFPEGRITRTGAMDAFRPGFLAINKNTEAPVIPIHLSGLWGSIFSYEGGRPLRKWPRRWPYPVSIVIGRPIADPADPEQVRQAVAELGAQEPEQDAPGT